MHTFWIILFALIACFWVFYGLRSAQSASLDLPSLKDFPPVSGEEPTSNLSRLCRPRRTRRKATARDSGAVDHHLPKSRKSSRWTIARKTKRPAILDDAAQRDARLRVIHIMKELPQGWLGKAHALQKAYEASTGEYLLFTDAECPASRRTRSGRAMNLAQTRRLDHLTLLFDVDRDGFWETVLLTFFGLAMHLAGESHQVSNPNSRAYLGIGAFQLVRRTAYEACGTHKRLAMEVVDDMKLGKILKLGGYRSCVGVGVGFLRVRWHCGIRQSDSRRHENFFAGLSYSCAAGGRGHRQHAS